MEKVRIKVPMDSLNNKDTRVQVGINGKFYDIQRGAEVEVPKQVYVLLDEGGYSPSLLGAAEIPSGFVCEFCGKEAKNALGLAKHREFCEKNPKSPKYTG